AAVPDRGANDAAATHGAAAQVIVQRIAAQDVLLAEVPELRVGDGAGGVLVIHGVAALALGVRGLDDHVAAQVRHLAAGVAGAEVLEGERLVERDLLTVDRLDGARLGVRPLAAVGARRGGDDDLVAGLPAGDGLVQRDRGIARLRRLADLDPGAAHGGA